MRLVGLYLVVSAYAASSSFEGPPLTVHCHHHHQLHQGRDHHSKTSREAIDQTEDVEATLQNIFELPKHSEMLIF